MLNDQGTRGDHLRDLRNLYRAKSNRGKFGMKKALLPTTVPDDLASTITDEDAVEVAIIKLMMDSRSYTTDEVCEQLMNRGFADSAESIKPAMLVLHAQGWFETSVVAGNPCYHMRRGRTLDDLKIKPRKKTDPKAFKIAAAHIPDPKGQIRLEEGVAVALWKIMSDGKERTSKEMDALLREFGFDHQQAARHLDGRIHSNRFFDRRNGGRNMLYKLKAHIPMPAVTTANEEPSACFDYAHSDPTTDAGGRMLDDLDTAIKSELDRLGLTQEPAKPKYDPIASTDHVMVAIWKLMADGEEYTAGEVTILLADFGFKPGSISGTMTRFYQAGYTTRRTEVNERNQPVYTYRLKRLEMPDDLQPRSKASAAAPATVHEPRQESQPQADLPLNQVQHKEEETTMSAPTATTGTLLKVVPTEVAPVPLFVAKIEIRGVAYGFEELKQLYRELVDAGFRENAPKTATLVEASYTIKGTQFTREELNDLVGALRAFSRDVGNMFNK
ncbi:hypothetical protein [Paraburkholderia sp. BCC1886]|uniref:hypothetical protein n=1 Tax=Paraburkholderia sp. BCC1886 TaxID=2562670 RepID=UPI00118327A7|nr:hypothetical protein [Paraburkholderia sp. BCC1886]